MTSTLAWTFVGDPLVVGVTILAMALWLTVGLVLARAIGRAGGSTAWALFWFVLCWPITVFIWWRRRDDSRA